VGFNRVQFVYGAAVSLLRSETRPLKKPNVFGRNASGLSHHGSTGQMIVRQDWNAGPDNRLRHRTGTREYVDDALWSKGE